MYSVLARMIDRLDGDQLPSEALLPWSCPIPSFGNVSTARIATLGINPSNQEFTSSDGQMLTGTHARFPTLASLGLQRWSEATWGELRKIVTACSDYFRNNPYDWFKTLERMVGAGGGSFFGREASACHLDVVPYATRAKWGSLGSGARRKLVSASADLLGPIVRDSDIRLLILNGRSVASYFEDLMDGRLDATEASNWSLLRAERDVPGVFFRGRTTSIGGIDLDRSIAIVGFNHNLQSSYGMTRQATSNIADHLRPWIEIALQ